MKLEYNGRWLRLCLELFPKRESPERIRYEPPRNDPATRRRLMRRIQAELGRPATAT